MAKVYISYRAECADICGRMYDWLARKFGAGNIVMSAHVPPGHDAVQRRIALVSQSDVVLVVIGYGWLADPRGQPLLQEPYDQVRVELETALPLYNTRKLALIPVLVHGAGMPTAPFLPPSLVALTFVNAVPVRSEPDFRLDMERLLAIIQQKVVESARGRQKRRLLGHTPWLTLLATLPILSIVLFAFLDSLNPQLDKSVYGGAIIGVGLLALAAAWICSSIISGVRKQWLWLVGLALGVPFLIAFAFFGIAQTGNGTSTGTTLYNLGLIAYLADQAVPIIYCLASR